MRQVVLSLFAAAVLALWDKLRPDPWPGVWDMLPYIVVFALGIWIIRGLEGSRPGAHVAAKTDDADGEIGRVALTAERARADIAEGRVKQLVADNDMLRKNFTQAQEQMKESEQRLHAAMEREVAATGARIRTEQTLGDLQQQVEADASLVKWARQTVDGERPVVGWLAFEGWEAVADLHEIGPTVILLFKFRYTGVFPLVVGEGPLTGQIMYRDRERYLGSDPTSRTTFVSRSAYQNQLRVFVDQKLSTDEKNAILQDTQAGKRVELGVSGLSVTVRNQAPLPDGSSIDERLSLAERLFIDPADDGSGPRRSAGVR